MSTKVLRVESIEIKILKSNPPQLLINCDGMASTPGWENPELVLLEKAPINGIYEFDFCATPPSGMIPQVIVPISASYHFGTIPDDFKGVKINASSNSMEQQNGVEDKVELDKPKTFQPKLEVLRGITITNKELKIRVNSGGCTNEDSFQINVIKGFTGIPPYILEVYRIHPDYCQMYLPDGVELSYNLKELGIEPHATLNLQNRIGNSQL